jgi:hypothetical protein
MATHPIELDAVKARQGVTGHGVRYVLGYGLALAALAMVLVLMFAR